jgi:hypothetical protein
MGRPLKMTETVVGVGGNTLKVGAIGNTNQTGNQIQLSAFLPLNTDTVNYISGSGGTSARASYILKQKSSRRFTCVNATDGVGICKLVVSSPSAGECRITATDSAGGTYYVSKISGKKATLIRATGTQFADGASVAWNLIGAVLNQSVIITGA